MVKALIPAFIAAVNRLDKSLSPNDTLRKLSQHKFTYKDCAYLLHFALAVFWLSLMTAPSFPTKLLIPLLYTAGILIPLTSQFLLPATPILSYLLAFYSSRFLPTDYRPAVSVSFLPTLESVLYGANISDLLTRFTHPILDVAAWLPYGVGHFTVPFVVALFLWLFRPKEALHLWARTFGYMNLLAVLTQDVFPCAAPWYELIYGLTPASYDTPGSAGGLARIDALLGGHGYQTTFAASPVVFGAFPSLHAGNATLEALFLSLFFPQTTKYVWAYAGVLYWATMYLTHHYLIDVVGGGCMAIASFYLFLPEEFRGPYATAPPGTVYPTLPSHRLGGSGGVAGGRNKYELYDLEEPRSRSQSTGRNQNGHTRKGSNAAMLDLASEYELEGDRSEEEEMDITFPYRSPGVTPTSSAPFLPSAASRNVGGGTVGGSGVGKDGTGRKSHKHTASIASLVRADEGL